MTTGMAWGTFSFFFLNQVRKKIKNTQIKKKVHGNMRARKSLFSEVNFLLKCLSCSRSSDESRSIKTGPLQLKWAEGGSAWKRDPVKAASAGCPASPHHHYHHHLPLQRRRGANPKHRVRQSPSQSYSSEKPYSWQVHFCFAHVRCILRGCRRLKLVVMRPTEREERGKLRALRKVVYCYNSDQTRDKRMQRGLHGILQPCWCN